MEESSRVKAACGYREGLQQQKPWCQRGSSEASGLWRLLVSLEGERFGERLAQPSPALGATSLRRWVRWSPISCFSRTQLCRKSWKWESAWQNQGRKIQKALAQILLPETGGFLATWVLPHSSWEASACPGKGHSCHIDFAFSRDSWCPWTSPQQKILAHTIQSHIVAPDRETQREESAHRCMLNQQWMAAYTAVE